MIHEVTSQEEFDQTLQENETVIYDFSAEWCGSCGYIEPVVLELSEAYTDIKVYKLDVDKVSSVAKSQDIQAMPTLKLYKNGQLVDKVVGPDQRAIESLFHN